MIDPISALGSSVLGAVSAGRPHASPEQIERGARNKLDNLTNTEGAVQGNRSRFDRINFNSATAGETRFAQYRKPAPKEEFASIKLIGKSMEGLQDALPKLAEAQRKKTVAKQVSLSEQAQSSLDNIKSKLRFDLAEGKKSPGFGADEIEERNLLDSTELAEERFALKREENAPVARSVKPGNETGTPEQEGYAAQFSPAKQKVIESYQRFASYQNPNVLSHAVVV